MKVNIPLLFKNICIDYGGYRGYLFKTKMIRDGEKVVVYHPAHDTKTPADHIVRFHSSGKVIYSKETNGFGGKIINGERTAGGVVILETIKNGKKFSEIYAHLNRKISVGKYVKKGDIAGTIIPYLTYWKGSLVRADHLHFSVWKNGGIPHLRYWGYVEIKDLIYFTNPYEYLQIEG